MATASGRKRMLRATLCEVERGVFYASYSGTIAASDADELTTYQVGTTAADAKRRIERRAHDLGYDVVMWTETNVVPLFAGLAKGEPLAAASKPA
jgi:hypothetical protein